MKSLKTLKITSSVLFGFALSNASAFAITGHESSGGGDRIEPLFVQAQQDVVVLLGNINLSQIDTLMVDPSYKTWLKEDDRLTKLQFYAKAMKLSFRDDACNDGGEPRGASFDASDPMNPVMCVSYSLNQTTTPAQAEALVIHEAGHFTGEMDHLFLSSLGVALVANSPANASATSCVQTIGAISCSDRDEGGLGNYAVSCFQDVVFKNRDGSLNSLRYSGEGVSEIGTVQMLFTIGTLFVGGAPVSLYNHAQAKSQAESQIKAQTSTALGMPHCEGFTDQSGSSDNSSLN
jgi:hypothetical protein